MKKIVRIFAIVVSALLCGTALAETPAPTEVPDDKINEIVGKSVPDEISVKLTEESEDAVALKACQKTLGGLQISKKCCADPKCVRKALKQKADADYEKRRAVVNRRFCLEYGGKPEICDDAFQARAFVIKYRADKEREEEAKRASADDSKLKAEAKRQEAIKVIDDVKKKVAEAEAKAERDRKLTPVAARAGGRHHLEFGLQLNGLLEGAYGGTVYINYFPPQLGGERLSFGVTGGSLVVVRNRLSLANFNPVARLFGEANMSFRFFDWKDLSFELGGSYCRLGRYSPDRLTAEMFGPTATLNIGALRLHAGYLWNTGPEDGYLSPKWGMYLGLGFRFWNPSF